MAKREKIKIYTDGSAIPNPGESGSGLVVELSNGKLEYHCGNYLKDSTNNIAELLALLRAFELISKDYSDCSVIIYTDSQYTLKVITVWARLWAKNNWYNHNGRPVKNRDIIESVYKAYRELKPRPRIRWVKGHSDNRLNDIADKLANRARIDKIVDWIKLDTI